MNDEAMIPDPGDASGDVASVEEEAIAKRKHERTTGTGTRAGARPAGKGKKRKKRKDAGRPRVAPNLPDGDEIPEGLRTAPGARDRAPARPKSAKAEARELHDQIAWLLGLVNTGFLMFAPCGCDPSKYEGITGELIRVGAAHVDTCPRMWALDGDETEQLTTALVDEMSLHPEWGAQLMEAAGKWQPHIALAIAIGTIAISRAQRPGMVIPLLDKLTPEQRQMVEEAIAAQGVPATPATPIFHDRRAAPTFTEAAAAPVGVE